MASLHWGASIIADAMVFQKCSCYAMIAAFKKILDLTVPARCDTYETDTSTIYHDTDIKNNIKKMPGSEVKSNTSFIYSNIWIYRLVMNMLYLGRYRQRFKDITNELKPEDNNIVEFCFGDIFIASYCKKTARHWVGYDINDVFVNYALKRGYNAVRADVLSLESLPAADVLIFAGSLYHFHENMHKIWQLMTSCAPKIILSEPIKNITAIKNFVGKIGARATAVQDGAEAFRFDRGSLIEMLDSLKEPYNFTYEIVSEKKDILIIIHERDQHRHSGL